MKWTIILAAAILIVMEGGDARAQGTANLRINASRVGEPTWHNYGSTYTDANGNVNQVNMSMPFFHTASIDTTVLVSLGRIEKVVTSMQAERVNGNTKLMVATASGDVGTVKELLAKRALVNTKSTHGSTALMVAAAGGHDAIVKLLLARGARVDDSTRHGYRALMLAAYYGHASTAELLLNSKARVNAVDSDRHTALLYAVSGGHEAVVKALLKADASPGLRDKSGVSPLGLATLKKDETLVSLLAQVDGRKRASRR